jgi:hypothetical protein
MPYNSHIKSKWRSFDMKNLSLFIIFGMLAFLATIKKANALDGLIAYYPFNWNAHDESGNGNDGIVHGATLTADRFGSQNNAYLFDGEDDYIDIGNNTCLRPSLPITISVWIKLNNNKSNFVFANNIGTDINNYYGIILRLDKKVEILYGDGGLSGLSSSRSKIGTTLLKTGKWYNITCVIRDATDIDIYVNGVNDGGFYNGSADSLVYSDNYSGAVANYRSYFFNGSIDDIYYFNRALTEKEIVDLYIFNQINIQDKLVAFYPFNGNANDESGNGNNGIVYGAQLTENRFGNRNSAYIFDGEDDYIDIGSKACLKAQLPITLSAWIKVYDNSINFVFANNIDLFNYYGIILRIEDTIQILYGDGGPGHSCCRRSKIGYTYIEPFKWYNITCVVRDAMDMDLYINGENEPGYYNGEGGPIAYSNYNSGAIGRFDNNISYFFHGVIDDIYFFNRALSDEEITLRFSGKTAVESNDIPLEQPMEIKLNQNYPNPFNQSTMINYTIPNSAFISLKVFNIRGEEIRTLVDEFQVANSYQVTFNTESLPTGLYVYELKVGDEVKSIKKMLYLK